MPVFQLRLFTISYGTEVLPPVHIAVVITCVEFLFEYNLHKKRTDSMLMEYVPL